MECEIDSDIVDCNLAVVESDLGVCNRSGWAVCSLNKMKTLGPGLS